MISDKDQCKWSHLCFLLSVFNQVPELSLSFSNITSVQFVLFRIVYRDEKCPKENEDVSLNLRLKHISSWCCPWVRLVRVEFCRCCITSSLYCIDERMYTCTGFQSYMSQLLHICIVIVFSVTIVVLFMNIIIIPVVGGSVSPLSPGADLNKTAIKGSAKGKRSVCSYSRKNINGNRAKNLSRTVLPSVLQSWSREWFRGLLVGETSFLV